LKKIEQTAKVIQRIDGLTIFDIFCAIL